MILSIETGNRVFSVDTDKPLDISIPLDFTGPQPNAFGVAAAWSEPCMAGEIVGDTRHGGSCNFESVTLVPHCNGTHTECVGHITHERIGVNECLTEALIPAVLITVEPEAASSTSETYSATPAADDLIITARSIRDALAELSDEPIVETPALIIRTIPNDADKLSRSYGEEIPAYFSSDAIGFIVSLNTRHLLTDLPSIDRMFDEGRLSNHRTFWDVDPGSFELGPNSRLHSTITELIFVPETVEDGEYLLNLQIAPFVSDASPSRPVLFRPIRTEEASEPSRSLEV